MRRTIRAVLWFGCMVAFGLGAGSAWAHKGSDAYLDVQEVGQQTGQKLGQRADDGASASAAPTAGAPLREFRFALSVAIKDLDLVVPIDANADGKVTWGEIKAAMPLVLALLNEVAKIEPPPGRVANIEPPPALQANAAACRLNWQSDGIERRTDGAYLRVAALARCSAGQALALRYTLLKDQDATHRLLVAGRIADKDLLTTTSPLQQTALLLSPGVPSLSGAALVAAGAPSSSRWTALRDYFSLGVHHLLEGYDHLAFLLALVLPLRLNLRRNSSVQSPISAANSAANNAPHNSPVNSRLDGRPMSPHSRHPAAYDELSGVTVMAHGSAVKGNVWFALLRTITAFTIGHSITLMLATFGWTQASPVWVEPVIALSIGVTALLNLRPVRWLRVDVLALLFGMVHGFGFAGLLKEAAAPSGLLPWALAGFNVGVEAGQLIAVSAWVLLSQLFVARAWYPSVVVRGGSVLLVLVATFWFWQRVR